MQPACNGKRSASLASYHISADGTSSCPRPALSKGCWRSTPPRGLPLLSGSRKLRLQAKARPKGQQVSHPYSSPSSHLSANVFSSTTKAQQTIYELRHADLFLEVHLLANAEPSCMTHGLVMVHCLLSADTVSNQRVNPASLLVCSCWHPIQAQRKPILLA